MASGSGARVYNSTLAASVDTVLLTTPCQAVRVTNLTGSAPIWFTVSHPGGPCPVPIVGSTQAFCAASVVGNAVNVRNDGMYGSVIQLISSGTPAYVVEVQSVNSPS